MLPISLIIFGATLVVTRLLNCVYDCRCMFEERDFENTPLCIQALNVIFFLASFGLFMAGKFELTRYLFLLFISFIQYTMCMILFLVLLNSLILFNHVLIKPFRKTIGLELYFLNMRFIFMFILLFMFATKLLIYEDWYVLY